MTILDRIKPRNEFVTALRFLASRVALPFDTVATQLGSLDQPKQIAAKIKQLVELLPLPEPSLPIIIGSFRRVDCAAEFGRLPRYGKTASPITSTMSPTAHRRFICLTS